MSHEYTLTIVSEEPSMKELMLSHIMVVKENDDKFNVIKNRLTGTKGCYNKTEFYLLWNYYKELAIVLSGEITL